MAIPTTPWNTHKCFAEGCRREVDGSRAFCPSDWAKVPASIKELCAGNSAAADSSALENAVRFLKGEL